MSDTKPIATEVERAYLAELIADAYTRPKSEFAACYDQALRYAAQFRDHQALFEEIEDIYFQCHAWF